MKYKKGEEVAITLLKKMNIQIDENYHDDNSQKCMPDLKYKKINKYIEVTHTKHNHNIFPNKFSYLSIKEQNEKIKKVNQALDRIQNKIYEKNKYGKLTKNALILHNKDCRLCEEVYGFSLKNPPLLLGVDEKNSDIRCRIYSLLDIVYIINHKSNLHKENIDLFCFVEVDEWNYLIEDFKKIQSNKYYTTDMKNLIECIKNSSFENIFIHKHNLYALQKLQDKTICKYNCVNDKCSYINDCYFIDEKTIIIKHDKNKKEIYFIIDKIYIKIQYA